MTTTIDVPESVPFLQRLTALRWDNWRGGLLVFIVGMAVAIPPAAEIFVLASAALAALFAATVIVNAWGRYIGGLLVAPALALLFLMNVFPLLWSFGLSFFNYRSNRARAPTWVGLENYANVLSDPEVWDRLHNTVILASMTVAAQMIVGFLLALLFSKQFPLRRFLLILVLTPMMLSFVAVGAFFRYYYDPTFGLLSQAVRLITGQPFILMGTVWGSRIGIVFADAWMWSPFVMLLVLAGLVSVPKYPSRGRGHRPRLPMAPVLVDHLPIHPRTDAACAAVPHDRGVQAVRSRLPPHQRRTRHLDRDDRAARLPDRIREQQNERIRRRSPISCCSR